jgi:hypothetical protein
LRLFPREESTSRDNIVTFEGICASLDEPWWHDRRARLETQFRQDAGTFRAQDVRLL